MIPTAISPEELKEKLTASGTKIITPEEHTKYLVSEDLILSTEYPDGVEIKPYEIGYSLEEDKRILTKEDW